MKSTYTIAGETPGFVAIVDNANETGAMSVTNDAEEVVKSLLLGKEDRKYKRIFYRDTENRWDELIHNGTEFTGFQPIEGVYHGLVKAIKKAIE